VSEPKRSGKFVGRLIACIIGGAAMTAVTSLLPALSRDEPWLNGLSEDTRGMAGDNEVAALTGGDVWMLVSAVWIDVPQSATLVSLREQEVRSVTKLPKWAALPPIVESNRRYESIATGVPFKCLVGCRLMNAENPTQVASTLTLAQPLWNTKVRSVPIGVRPLQLLANVGVWSLFIALIVRVPGGGKKNARTNPGVEKTA